MRRKFGQVVDLLCLSLLILLGVLSTPAFAYVEPGSGSVIVTTVLGLVAAVSYTFRRFFYNIRAKIFGNKNQKIDRSLDD